jgi:superfamily II DNA/RNA helicase/HKD family nuclease
MSTKFFTNSGENTLLNKFKGVFEHNKDVKFFDALVGYFRASGYFKIRPFLDDVPNIRILVGINVDAILAQYQSKGLLFRGDSNKTLQEFLNDIKSDIQKAAYSKEVEDGILQFMEDITTGKIEVKAHPNRTLHAKIYIFKPEDWNEHKPGFVITGSSNLTEAALGGKDEHNYEFNVILRDYDDVQFATKEFETLWAESISVLPVEIKKLKKETYINDEFTPFEVYIKFLIEYFGKSVEFDPNSISDLPDGFMRLNYQVDAVNMGYKLLEKHGGFFLSDVVGLGKTVVGTLIAKKFFYTNNFPSHISNILIIVPPALKANWIDTLEKFELKNYKIITNGSLHKVTHANKYDLVIVDEAHKFRNDTSEAYNELQKLCKTKTKNKLPDGSFSNKKVILISATPLNNRPEDIANQVYLFQDSKDSTLEVSNLQHFFRKKIDRYKKLKDNQDIAQVQREVADIYEGIREMVIAPLTIRRTRSDLKEHEQYSNDLKEQGISFPDVEKPRKILYKLDAELEVLYDKTIRLLTHKTEGIKYYRYQAIRFLKGDLASKYSNAVVISEALAMIMKTTLIKRLDSSFFAFQSSLLRFYNATKNMQTMIANNKIYIAPNVNVNQYIMDGKEDELLELLITLQTTDPTIEICTKEDFKEDFFKGIEQDFEILGELVTSWEAIGDKDPKFDMFLDMLNSELLSKEVNHQKKLVVFSEAGETTEYLKRRLKENGFDRTLWITSKTRNQHAEDIKVNFDANIPREDYRSDYDIIITTEVLAEGINLHRSNVIVNYDTPWNSTKLMQRIGRVNRIGSVAPKIYIYNFYPTAEVNNELELEKRAIMKLQAFHSALGEDSEIYSPDEEIQSFGLFDKDVDEEKDERLAYLMELRGFKKQNPAEFRRIKNMPLRARVGRKDRTKRESTICFIRNQRRDAFYWVKGDKDFEEMSFTETAREFRADVPEKAIALHGMHHEQVNQALEDFHSKLQEDIKQDRVLDTTQGPNEKRAKAYIDGIMKFPFVSNEEKKQLKAAKQAISLGRFQKLQREINKLKKDVKKAPLKPVELLDAMLTIINRYPIQNEDLEDRPLVTIKSFDKLKPEIIISQSFDHMK